MSHALASHQPTQKLRLPGRKMALGRYVTSERLPGGIGYNAGVCDNCHNRNLMTQEEAVEFSRKFVSEKKSYFVRLMTHLKQLRSI